MTGALRARKSDPASAPRPRLKVRARVTGREKVRAPRKSGRAVSADSVSAPDVFDERADHRVVVHGVEWRTYLAMTRDPGFEHRKLTYDEGVLEIMSPGALHEEYRVSVRRLVETLCEETGTPYRGSGAWTMRKVVKRKGLEPDDSWWMGADAVRAKPKFPNLVVEVEVSTPAVPKEPIYAELGVAEVWRFDGTGFIVRRLTADGRRYRTIASSALLPWLDLGELVPWVKSRAAARDEGAWVARFRRWVRGRPDFPKPLFDDDKDLPPMPGSK